MATVDVYFTTAINKFSYPSTSGPASIVYNVIADPLSTLPTDPIAWTGAGSYSFSSQGMTVDSGGYIQCSDLYGSDILVDVEVEGISPAGPNKVLDFVESDGSVVSVWIDFTTNEIWLDDVIGALRAGFRAGISDDHKLFFRIGVRLIDGVFVARLYSATKNSPESPLLQQTAGPSTTQDLINIGRLRIGCISGSGSYTINTLQIKTWSYPGEFGTTPDSYYPFPQITSMSPDNGELAGGDKLRLLSPGIDVNVGDELLLYEFSSNDVSTGDAASIPLDGELLLQINSIGTAKRRFLNTYSGDRPSGVHLSFDLQADAAIVSSPPQTEVIVGAVEYGVDGVVYTIQMVVSRALGAVFKVVQSDGGVAQFNQSVLTTTQANHTLEFIRGSNSIILRVNGTQVLKSFIPDGPGVVAMYSTSTVVVNLTSKFVNFKVRPVLLIGNEVATLT